MDIEQTLNTLKALLEDSSKLTLLSEAQRLSLMTLSGQISRPDKVMQKERNRQKNRVLSRKRTALDQAARAQTGIRKARELAVFSAPLQLSSSEQTVEQEAPELQAARNCYVCKAEFKKLHFFYDSMCPSCAEINYQKRFQTTSLEGQVALITGGRLKIGYHAALMMLRAGAEVIVTTRFPIDSATRFSKEPDYEKWGHRLQVYGLDLRHTPSVEIFCRMLQQKLSRLDILINNAAQTVRRPPGFYAHLIAQESKPYLELTSTVQSILKSHEECRQQLNQLSTPASLNADDVGLALPLRWDARKIGIGLTSSAELSQIPYSYDQALTPAEIFPDGRVDADLQQVDLRTTNSWRLTIGQVPAPEMLEVQLVNSVAPFILCNELIHIMRRERTGQKHIVNVTAMEGKFYRFKKEDRHPHTNMAKAALNMLTHTAAGSLAEEGIFMNAVDTGWVTDEDPVQLALQKQKVHDFQPPLDIVDGAARICDPFFHGILTGHHWHGKFLKDYAPIDW